MGRRMMHSQGSNSVAKHSPLIVSHGSMLLSGHAPSIVEPGENSSMISRARARETVAILGASWAWDVSMVAVIRNASWNMAVIYSGVRTNIDGRQKFAL